MYFVHEGTEAYEVACSAFWPSTVKKEWRCDYPLCPRPGRRIEVGEHIIAVDRDFTSKDRYHRWCAAVAFGPSGPSIAVNELGRHNEHGAGCMRRDPASDLCKSDGLDH
jgi:hypothetical protein